MITIPAIPFDTPPQLRTVLDAMRAAILQLQGSVVPPNAPTNLTVTPQALGNYIQFTRPDGADYFILYRSTSPDFNQNIPITLGAAASYLDQVGTAGTLVYYWVRAFKNSGVSSDTTGPVSGLTLAAGAVGAIPAPPPPTDNPALNTDAGGPSYGSGSYGGRT